MKKWMKALFVLTLTLILTGILGLGGVYAQAASTIKLNATKKTLEVDATYKLQVKGTKKTVKWSSTNKKVAKVSSGGNVRAIGEGKCKIVAKVDGQKLTCTITVKAPKSNVPDFTISYDETNARLSVTDIPEEDTTKKLQYEVHCNYYFEGEDFGFAIFNPTLNEYTLPDKKVFIHDWKYINDGTAEAGKYTVEAWMEAKNTEDGSVEKGPVKKITFNYDPEVAKNPDNGQNQGNSQNPGKEEEYEIVLPTVKIVYDEKSHCLGMENAPYMDKNERVFYSYSGNLSLNGEVWESFTLGYPDALHDVPEKQAYIFDYDSKPFDFPTGTYTFKVTVTGHDGTTDRYKKGETVTFTFKYVSKKDR